tara:strand:+ start:9362 stop:9856 length:495 start_codon:yes stop_codon:yes gene_type:complete
MLNQKNISTIRNYGVKPFFFRLYLFINLPMGFLSGMKIRELNEEKCIVTVPFKRLNKNPFKSTFWAVLGMAGEMNGAALILQYTYKHHPSIATLPINCEAEFYKKATSITTFTCNDSKMIKEKIEEAVNTGKGVIIKTTAIGRDSNNEKLCKFIFTWSIKLRSK